MAIPAASSQPPFLLSKFAGAIVEHAVDLDNLRKTLENEQIAFKVFDGSKETRKLLTHQANSLDEHIAKYIETEVSIVLFKVGEINESAEDVYATLFSSQKKSAIVVRCSRYDNKNMPLIDALTVLQKAAPEKDLSGVKPIISEGWIYPPKALTVFFEEEYGVELRAIGVSPLKGIEGTYVSKIDTTMRSVQPFHGPAIFLAVVPLIAALLLGYFAYARSHKKKTKGIGATVNIP